MDVRLVESPVRRSVMRTCEVETQQGSACGIVRNGVRDGLVVCRKHRKLFDRNGSFEYQRKGHIYRGDPTRGRCAHCGEDTDGSQPYHTRCESLKRYRLSLPDYEAMLERQGHACAACGSTEAGGRWNSWHIDHNHDCCPDTGKSCGQCVRGLLCNDCNRGIGLFKDDPDRLVAAAAYLISHSNNPTREEVPA